MVLVKNIRLNEYIIKLDNIIPPCKLFLKSDINIPIFFQVFTNNRYYLKSKFKSRKCIEVSINYLVKKKIREEQELELITTRKVELQIIV